MKMKTEEELEASDSGQWKWAAIFRPTKANVFLAVVIYPVLLLLLFNSIVLVDYVSRNRLLIVIGYIVNIIPVLFIWLAWILLMRDWLPFPLDALLVVMTYFAVPGLWAYFLSCIAISLLSARKRSQSLQ